MAATLTNIGQWVTGGASKVQHAPSSSGRPYDNSVLTAGNSSGMADVDGFRNLSASFPDARVLQIEGDDGVRATIQFESGELPTFGLTTADFVSAFYNSANGISTIDAQSVYDFIMLNPTGRTFADLFMMFTRRAVSKEAGSVGNGYETLVLPLVTASFTGTGDFQTGDNAGEYSFSLSVNPVTQTPWGASLTGVRDVSGFLFWSEYIPTFDVFIQNNSDTTFTPAHSKAPNSQVIAWDGAAGGAPSTLSIDYSSDDLDFTTAQASGNITTALYERTAA